MEKEALMKINASLTLNRATLACKNSGQEIDDHFVEANKMLKWVAILKDKKMKLMLDER